MKQVFCSEYDNLIFYTEGFKVGDKGFVVDTDESEVCKVEVSNVREYDVNSVSKDDMVDFPGANYTAEFITDKKIYDVGFKVISEPAKLFYS